MSTNNNNSSQTLFRFAAMRNPELSNPKNKNKRFVFRSEVAKNASKIDPLVTSATSLKSIFKSPSSISGFTVHSEDSLKALHPNFYDFAVWIARNKSTATKEDFDKQIALCKTFGALVADYVLWDNLTYQVVTQKDFYAKELIMQYLHLAHILENYDGSDESYKDMIKAKVVLPKELFKVSQGSGSTGNSTTQKTFYNDKAMKFAEATILLRENQKLTDSLTKLEKTYKKQHDEAYKSAYTEYEGAVKPIIQSLQKEASAADRKKQILENRINYLTQLSVADPEKFYANAELDMELHRIKEEIMKITVSEAEIPDFEFNFGTPEIDAIHLGRTMSSEDQSTLCRLLGASTITEALSGITTFDELNQSISSNNQALQQTVLNNTVLNQQVSTTVGGVVIPVNNNSATSGYLPFSIKTYARSSTEWSLMLALSNNIEVASAKYKTFIKDVEFSSTSLSSLGGGSYLLFDLPRIPVSKTYQVEEFVVEGELTSRDGITYRFNVKLVIDPYDLDRLTKHYNFRGADGCFPVENPPKPETPETPENPQTPGTSVESGAFIPSGFGMKNIGVADYLKVEQSTYCYVEGDVAHIENIMAREYKERATRRLKRSESQTTSSSETEKEKLTDTTSTERHEMQSEISKIMQESKDFAVQAGVNASWEMMGGAKFGAYANASYATHNSKEESTRQAVTEAKDITARALDRIVTKVKEERIDKVLEEYEENNKHGFDNTKGSNHVVGVYRWVDKVVKNQIYNYGKRMMFEFMIPEPAKLHTLGTKMIDASSSLAKPIDPRESSVHQMKDFTSLSNDITMKYWLSKFNVEIDEFPVATFYLSKSFHEKDPSHSGKDDDKVQVTNGSGEVEIPEGYMVDQVNYIFNTYPHGFHGYHQAFMTIAGRPLPWITSIHETQRHGTLSGLNVRNKLAFSFATGESPIMEGSLDIKCNLTSEAKNAWLQKTFNKIIEAYEVELEKYNQALAEAKALGVQIKGSNPGFYRKIENTILRKNCISYMLEQNPNAELTFGKKKYYINDGATAETFTNTDIKVDSSLDQYAAFVKFMEQAFEWDIMSYYFYPFYWGDRNRWSDLYQFDDNDPTFRAFMQSGMARVIVTVRPGFEEAVRHFLATGQIWNGGEVPVIDDPLFLSIVDEMRAAVGEKQGEPWREKIPTSLTILQADSIGLKVEKALPCNCEPGVKFDDQLGELCGSNFALNNNQIGQSADKWIEISFNEMDDISFKTIQNFKDAGVYPKTFECLGNTFEIDDLAESEPSIKLYKRIAEEVSQIEGVEAYPTGENGITFKVNARLIKNFDFKETSINSDDRKFVFTTDDSYLKVTYPLPDFGIPRILDKNGNTLSPEEYEIQAPISKFLV